MEDVYGPDVEFRIEEEDREPITKPLVQVYSTKTFYHHMVPVVDKYMLDLMREDHTIRNLSLIGHFLTGKTSLVDCLLNHIKFEPDKFTDSLFMEQERGMSIKSSPVSFIKQSLRGKSYLLNLMDTPGHINFSDEVTAALCISDGIVLIVDASEGIMLNTERLLKHAIQQRQHVVLCINKIDKLILELRLPPNDAYHKLKRIIDDVNELIITYSRDESKLLSPLLGNVCFTSSKYSTCFSLFSFAKLYIDRSKTYDITYKQLASKLWGDYYLDSESSKFVKKPPTRGSKRSFVEYILEPLYKLYRIAIEDPDGELVSLAETYNIKLPKTKNINVQPLLRDTCAQLFGTFQALIDMVVNFIPSPQSNTSNKVPMIWTGDTESPLTKALYVGDREGPLLVHVVKHYLSRDVSNFNVLGRVMSGTLKANSEVKVLGESYSEYDDEDCRSLTVGRLWIHCTRFNIEVKSVPAGNWVLIEGIHESIVKTCSIIDADYDDQLHIFRPLKFNTQPICKIAIEPVKPSELPKMVEGLRKCNKSYPILQIRVEESGEHVMIGTGELYLDCVMHDLRKIFTEIEIRVSDPVVCFSETVTELSECTCVGESPNKKNLIKMTAEPLGNELTHDLEHEKINLDMDHEDIKRFFRKRHGWDDLASRSIWAFGPEVRSTNILLNETLPYEVDAKLLNSIKNPIVHAFQWATKEGPLCEEPMRGVKFKLLDADIAQEMIHRSSGQIIPTVRRVSYLSFLKAAPRMMEPYLFTEIVAPPDVVKGIVDSQGRRRTILEDLIVHRRRGRITKKLPMPGTILYKVEAVMPAIDSFGFETDLRIRTTGQAFCQSIFDYWDVVPGDPLDRSADEYLVPLEPQQNQFLAREFLLKTRRRKGLSDDVNEERFIDDAMRQAMEMDEVDDEYAFIN